VDIFKSRLSQKTESILVMLAHLFTKKTRKAKLKAAEARPPSNIRAVEAGFGSSSHRPSTIIITVMDQNYSLLPFWPIIDPYDIWPIIDPYDKP
jgi:hypothetical protein